MSPMKVLLQDSCPLGQPETLTLAAHVQGFPESVEQLEALQKQLGLALEQAGTAGIWSVQGPCRGH